MFTHTRKRFGIVAGAFIAVVSSGCATNARVTKLEGDIHDAQRSAEYALAQAKEAKERAKDADERSLRTEEMLNRSFHHSMRK